MHCVGIIGTLAWLESVPTYNVLLLAREAGTGSSVCLNVAELPLYIVFVRSECLHSSTQVYFEGALERTILARTIQGSQPSKHGTKNQAVHACALPGVDTVHMCKVIQGVSMPVCHGLSFQ